MDVSLSKDDLYRSSSRGGRSNNESQRMHDEGFRLHSGSGSIAARNANLQLQRHSSPPSANTSPRTYPGVEFSDTQAIFNHIHGPEGRSDGRSNRGDSGRTSPNSVLPQDSDSSARRHTELVAVGHRLVENCQHVNSVLDELLASASKLPAKRQSLRMSGTTSRTTVGLMLNGCAIDNVLPAMAMHADLLKGDIIIKVDGNPTNPESVPKQLLGDDIPGTSVMLTILRGNVERTIQLIRMATSDIADMRRVFEVFTNLKCRFPVISGEVDEVVTIWSEVVSGDALYKAQVANSMQRLQREGNTSLLELKRNLDKLQRNNELIRDAFDDARAVEDRLIDLKQQLIQFGKEVREQLSVQGTALKEVTRERDNFKDLVVEERVQAQMMQAQFDTLREEDDSIKNHLRLVTEERDKSRGELERMQGQYRELTDQCTRDTERLRASESKLVQAQSEADICKGQLKELRESYDAATAQASQLQQEKRQYKTELDTTKGLMDELRKLIHEKKEAMEILLTEHELRHEELDRALGALQAIRDEHEQTKVTHERQRKEKEHLVSELERTQGQLQEIRRMLLDRAKRLEETEILCEKFKCEVELANGSAVELRNTVAERENRIEDLMTEVITLLALKSEKESLVQELSTQRTRYTEISSELAKCQAALEKESMVKATLVKEREGLWETNEKLVAKLARSEELMAQAKTDHSHLLKGLETEMKERERQLAEDKIEHSQVVNKLSKTEGELKELKKACTSLEIELTRCLEETLSDRNTVENMHGQILELREKLKNTMAELEMVRGLLLESEKLNCESQDNFQVVDSKRRAAERQLEEIRAQLSSEKQLRSMAEAKDGEREAIAAVELQVLQDRVAKLREQNKTLAEARERAEEERDDLDAQVSLLKAERGKVPRQEIQLREVQAQLIAKSKDWDLVIDARDKALKKCENLEVQVADLQDQVASAHEAGPKMSTLSRMLREQLTVKMDALKLVEEERDAYKKELNALELSLDISRQDLAAIKKLYEREQRARRQSEDERDHGRRVSNGR